MLAGSLDRQRGVSYTRGVTVAKTIDQKYGSLARFAEKVWENLGPGAGHAAKEEKLWEDIRSVCTTLLGKKDGPKAADLLRHEGFFSIVFPD